MNIQRFAITALGCALACCAFFLVTASGQSAAPLLVDASWLWQHLSDRDVVVLHVSGKRDYEAGHIPGARFISDADVTRTGGDEMYDLPPVEELRLKLASLGISDGSRIIVYFGGENVVPSATRVIFTLDYLGLGDQTSLLNGGLAAWKGAGKQITTDVKPVPPGRLNARPTKNVVADAAFVKTIGQRSGYRLVDARAPVFYNGTESSHEASGHIAGAVNIPFSQITDSELMIQRERLDRLFTAAGVKPGDTVVAYCHIGQQATAVIFTARLLGHPVMLYDGSMHDWSMTNHFPIQK